MPEARLIRRNHGLLPTGKGWFVVNAQEARWFHSSALGSYCKFEGSSGSGARFTQFGINGSRGEGRTIRYPLSEAARKHGAAVGRETTSPRSAYRHLPPTTQGACRKGDLPAIGNAA